jgi:hypothetical protein
VGLKMSRVSISSSSCRNSSCEIGTAWQKEFEVTWWRIDLIDSVVELMVGGLGVVSSCTVLAFCDVYARSTTCEATIERRHVEIDLYTFT